MDVPSVICGGIVLVLIDVVAGEIESGEEAFAARVGEELGIGQGGDRCLGVAADRSGGSCDVTTELDLLLQHVLHALVVGADEDEIGRLPAGLETEAGAGDLDEDRSAPPMVTAAGGDTLPILTAKDEGALLEAGHD